MNKKYKINGVDLIVTQYEHEHILDSIKQEKTKVWLRNNNLLVDYAFVSLVRDTGEQTDEQYNKQFEAQKLLGMGEEDILATRKKGASFLRTTHNDFYKRMAWPHKDNCSCKEKVEANIVKYP
jgi:hypothetical protein